MNRQESLPAMTARPRRMPIRRQQTFGKYEFATENDDENEKKLQKQHSVSSFERSNKTSGGGVPAHRPEIKGTCTTLAQDNMQVGKLKKRLGRTDSSVFVESDSNNTSGIYKVEALTNKSSCRPSIQITPTNKTKQFTRQMSQSSFIQNPTQLSKTGLSDTDVLATRESAIQTNCSSCPNLAVSNSVAARLIGERQCRTAPAKSPPMQPMLLNVPGVFITSPTHSGNDSMRKGRSADTISMANCTFFDDEKTFSPSKKTDFLKKSLDAEDTNYFSHVKSYRHSAPDLGDAKEKLQEKKEIRELASLSKSLSDAPERLLRQNKDSFIAQRVNPRISQILDFLYIGNVESAYDQRLLCKRQIGSVVDLSNMEPEDVPRHQRNPVPCTCGEERRHMRAVLRVKISETNVSDIKSHFERINRFIGIQEHKRSVLVFCNTLKNNLSVLVAAQYLMSNRNMNFRKAYSQIMKGRSDIELTRPYYELLLSLECELYPDEAELISFEAHAETRRASGGLLPREAWTDC